MSEKGNPPQRTLYHMITYSTNFKDTRGILSMYAHSNQIYSTSVYLGIHYFLHLLPKAITERVSCVLFSPLNSLGLIENLSSIILEEVLQLQVKTIKIHSRWPWCSDFSLLIWKRDIVNIFKTQETDNEMVPLPFGIITMNSPI